MNKKIKIIVLLFASALFLVPVSFAIYKSQTEGDVSATLASWNVTLEQNGVNSTLSVVPELSNATYTLNVKSLSDVDITYDVILSNIPSGVEVKLDDAANFTQPSNGTITFNNVGIILNYGNNRINSHTLTFRAVSGATFVSNQTVTINVVAKQIVSS